MKAKLFFLTGVILMVVMAGLAYADQSSRMELKIGDSVFACNCGADCPCKTMANKEGACTCGTPMVQAQVTKVEGDTAYLKAEDWEKERPFNMVGKYVCACGPKCKCNAVSQNPGKCPCGADMVKAE